MSKWLSWNVVVPLAAVVVLALTWGETLGPALVGLAAVFLIGAVLAAVHHAEVVAHRVGEPFGSLVLAAAVTVIEVALIVELMASGGNEAATLARDTAFAALMITTNGIAGLSLLLGSARYGETLFNAEGTGAALATLTTLATLSLVLPAFTTSEPGGEFSPGQLIFAAVASLLLYLLFVFTQTVRHRDFFLPIAQKGQKKRLFEDETHADPPSVGAALTSLGLLIAALAAVTACSSAGVSAIFRRCGDRGAGAAAGDAGGGARRAAGPHPNQPEPGLWLGVGQHRTHHSGDRAGVTLAEGAAGTWSRLRPVGTARADRRDQHADRRARAGNPTAG